MYVKSRSDKFNVLLNSLIGFVILLGGLIIGAIIIRIFSLPTWTFNLPMPITIIILLIAAFNYRMQREAARKESRHSAK